MLHQSTKVLSCTYSPFKLRTSHKNINLRFLIPLFLQEKEWLSAGWAPPAAATREQPTCGRHFLPPPAETSVMPVTSGCRQRLPSSRRQASRASRRLWRKIPRWKIREKGGKSRELQLPEESVWPDINRLWGRFWGSSWGCRRNVLHKRPFFAWLELLQLRLISIEKGLIASFRGCRE
jgi:hypothetical protein